MLVENIKNCFNSTITIIFIVIINKIIIIIKIAQTSIRRAGTYRLVFYEDYHMSRGDV